MKQDFHNNPVIAHRGAWKKLQYPENSIASVRQAVKLGCAGSEFDIWLTADDSLVIHHDPELAGFTIEKTAYSSFMGYPLSNGEALPTLRNYLLAGMRGNTGTHLVAEIKPSGISKERGQDVAEKVVKMVKELGAGKYVIYISFDYDILKKIHALDPGAITQYLNGEKSPQEIKADGISGLDYHISVFRKHPEWIPEAKNLQLMLNAWTVNEPADMQWLLQNGFDAITTNEPELLFSLKK
jgi:glycerophosphoryl diester phosphodiesterase